METQNKQWVCQPRTVADNHGQLGPEDLSSGNNKTTGTLKNALTTTTNTDLSEIHTKNGLDQHFIQHVEGVVCETSRQTILHILDEVTRLSTVEKLLLYLKLPTDLKNVADPLRQPLNPLGSRTEISQTIMWIRTHLEEEPELSLPKQEVYNEYTLYCANNTMKPLSTADFGKVMKQVYPSVRPRRLGTRGNSRYCYAGLHKRFKLETPCLPELNDRPQSTESVCMPGDLISAAWTIVREWAENVLGTQFHNVYTLAKYLVSNILVNSTSVEASVIMSVNADTKDGMSPESSYSSFSHLKHKEAQFQLHRKLQQREVFREQKRKLQVAKSEFKSKCKKTKLQLNATHSQPEPDTKQSPCDKPPDQLPDFSSFQAKKPEEMSPEKEKCAVIPEENVPPVERDGKLPIPRLPSKAKLNVVPVCSLMPARKGSKGSKYKAIQPKPAITTQRSAEEPLQTSEYLTRERLISVSNVDKDALDDYLHGGNNSQEQEEELLQYFKNTADGEGAALPPGTAQNNVNNVTNNAKCDKLSQLRLLLEQNLNADVQRPVLPDVKRKSLGAPQNLVLAHSGLPTKRRVSFDTAVMDGDTVPPSPNTRRKNFSFTPISPGPLSPGRQSKCSSTNASPFVSPRNTPVPRAKVSAHTATSFVATKKHVRPSLKAVKHESDMYGDSEKLFSDYMEEKHFVSPTDLMPKCNLTMSAPPSPMLPYNKSALTISNSNLLQKLLDSNAKVSYVPNYEKTKPEAPQQVMTEAEPPFGSEPSSYRSQSVPLHQMASFKTHMSPCIVNTQQTHFNFNFMSANSSVGATPVPNEFSDFDGFSDPDALLNNGLNNDNINQILNILETPEATTHTMGANEGVAGTMYQYEGVPALVSGDISMYRDLPSDTPKLVRSQSIDVDMELRGLCNQKFTTVAPSRSVPSTPLPFTKLNPSDLNLNNNNSEPGYGEDLSMDLFNQDYLLNGQPVKDGKPERQAFADAFGARRNLNALLEQTYGDAEFNTVVPNTHA